MIIVGHRRVKVTRATFVLTQTSENARLESTTERLRGERGRLRQQLAVALAADQTSREALSSLAGAVEQLRDGIAQRDAQIRDLLILHQYRVGVAEKAEHAVEAAAVQVRGARRVTRRQSQVQAGRQFHCSHPVDSHRP